MKAQLRSELIKLRSTRSGYGLFATMLGLVAFTVAIHGLGLPAERLGADADGQLIVFSRGEFLAALFAALFGALSMTNEIRHGTIRPTFLVSPKRSRVVVAKLITSAGAGSFFGLMASAVAIGVGVASLEARGIGVRLDGGDYTQLLAGSIGAGAALAAIGVGVGAIVRNQVPALIGISAWMLFLEGVLVGDVDAVAKVGRFAPGAAAAAISGQSPDRLLSPIVALALLAAWVAAATIFGTLATTERDVA
jgi:ABC-type transport system involved in multi-copper enzyme maturation permease subunit